MSGNNLSQVFERWRGDDKPLVLATVYETAGSTYSKIGAQMLINSEGDFQGMLSGGCLEGDLAERARQVCESGLAQAVTYDLTQDDDDLWGLGVGCDGIMRIILQRLAPAGSFEPLPAMLDAYDGNAARVAVTVIAGDREDAPAGSCAVYSDDNVVWSSLPDDLLATVGPAVDAALRSDQSQLVQIDNEGQSLSLLLAILRPRLRLLVLGAGLDSEPVVRLGAELGWRVTVSDHRAGYIAKGDFGGAVDVQCVPASELSSQVDLGSFDAVIVMSHHLASDETYLRQLAETGISYIGLLGPVNRRQRLLDSIPEHKETLDERVRGPAGIDIKASGPAGIALSIVAEIHRELVKP